MIPGSPTQTFFFFKKTQQTTKATSKERKYIIFLTNRYQNCFNCGQKKITTSHTAVGRQDFEKIDPCAFCA